jgi:hypothetical protein
LYLNKLNNGINNAAGGQEDIVDTIA